ncbi:hypothetical protein OH786_00805 [Streptomyces atratus]|uniref:hypothetical protein n=1 Tax=Streptomyces atratus TaxID=1893 RepID=UPI001C433C66|nr:hypothetical protein [Streptomyces atratus]
MAKTLIKRPGLFMSWFLLAALTVGALKIVPQPWSAGLCPVVLSVAMLLFSRTSVQTG